MTILKWNGLEKKFSIGNKTELVQVLQRNELIEQVNLLIFRILNQTRYTKRLRFLSEEFFWNA